MHYCFNSNYSAEKMNSFRPFRFFSHRKTHFYWNTTMCCNFYLRSQNALNSSTILIAWQWMRTAFKNLLQLIFCTVNVSFSILLLLKIMTLNQQGVVQGKNATNSWLLKTKLQFLKDFKKGNIRFRSSHNKS